MHVSTISRLFAIVISAVVVALSGCQAQPGKSRPISDSESIVTALGPEAVMPSTLQHLASIEARKGNLTPLDVPPPPGVEPELLAERRIGKQLSRLSLDEALAVLGSAEDDQNTSAGTAELQPDIDPQIEDAALREFAIGRDDALQRRHLAAVTHYLKAIELTPHNVSILRELARSYLGLGNQTKALQTYEQMLEIDPRHSEAVFMTGLAAADRREFDVSARLLGRKFAADESFTHDDGADALAEYVLGVSLGQLGYDAASIEVTRRVLERLDGTPAPSMYNARLGSLYRQRGELWRGIGDAYCRLGNHESALRAYDQSAGLPMPDPFALAPRVLYANLRLGKIRHAQLELYAALKAEAPDVSERFIGLCTYLRSHGGSLNALAREIVELQKQHPGDPSLVRAAAGLLNDDDATALLRQYVAEQPDNVEVIGELLRWLAGSNVRGAVELAVDIIAERSELTNAVVQQVFLAVGRPSEAVRAARALPRSPDAAVVEARLLMMIGGLGPAWSVLADAGERWPVHEPLHHTRMELAAVLEEPALLQQVIESWSGAVDAPTLLAQSRALRRARLSEQAIAAAERAVLNSGESAEGLTELAWAHLTLGLQQPQESDRAQLHGQDAVLYAEQAIEKDTSHEPAYRVLTAVFGSGGPLADPARLRDAARRLFAENPDSRLYKQLVAEESLARRRYEQALEQALNLYETQPSDSASLKMAVAAWRNMNRLEDAGRWLKRRLDVRPGDPHLLEQWATVQLMLNRAETAVTYLEEEIEIDLLNYGALRLLESTYQTSGRMDRAVELGEQRLLERPAGIRRELELASLYSGTLREQQAVQRLQMVLEQGDAATREQLVAATALASRLQSSVDGRDDLVVALVELTADRFDELPLELYRPALLVLAERERGSGVFETMARRAARDVAPSESNAPQTVLRWQRLAQDLVDAGHPEAAATVAESRIHTEPHVTVVEAHTVLCFIAFSAHTAMGGQAERSIALLRELRREGRLPIWPAVQGPPTLVESLYELSQMYHILGDEDGSVTILRELINIQPQHAMALNNLSYLLIERGDSDERTARMIELAHSLDPDEPNILDSIGWLRYKQGVFDDSAGETVPDDVPGDDDAHDAEAPARDGALYYIQLANDSDTTPSPEALDHLGDVQWRLGEQREAVNTWNRVVDMLTNRREVRETIEMYESIQEQVWWLVVVDGETIYDRNWGVILERTQQKLDAVTAGTQPPVAPTFAELQSAQ